VVPPCFNQRPIIIPFILLIIQKHNGVDSHSWR